jgi:hypothetical protein
MKLKHKNILCFFYLASFVCVTAFAQERIISKEPDWGFSKSHRAAFSEISSEFDRDQNASFELLIISDGKIEIFYISLQKAMGIKGEGLGNVSSTVEEHSTSKFNFDSKKINDLLTDFIKEQLEPGSGSKPVAFRTSNTLYYMNVNLPNSKIRIALSSELASNSGAVKKLERIAEFCRSEGVR